jgi:hypothetical protein
MQHISKGTIIVTISFVFIILLALIVLKIEYQIPKPENWSGEVLKYKQPITEFITVVDRETGRPIFWYSESSPVRATKVEKLESGKWIVVMEDIE